MFTQSQTALSLSFFRFIKHRTDFPFTQYATVCAKVMKKRRFLFVDDRGGGSTHVSDTFSTEFTKNLSLSRLIIVNEFLLPDLGLLGISNEMKTRRGGRGDATRSRKTEKQVLVLVMKR